MAAMLLAVNYHYVATEPNSSARAIFPISTDDFAAQLDELGRSFEFVSRDDVLAAVEHGSPLPARSCLVTFDDGLTEQLDLALPILRERGIPAVFFVCGEPLVEPRVLQVHKVHLLREAMPDGELLIELERHGARVGIRFEQSAVQEAIRSYMYDTPEAATLKYVLNVLIGPFRPELVDALFAEHFDEAELAARLYLGEEHVRSLEEAGALGSHGFGHLPLAALERRAIRTDLERGAAVLAELTGTRPRAFSYPYGSAAAVSEVVAREAAAAGFSFALTMERAVNLTLDEPLLLARVDTRDAPGGRSPLLSFVGDAVHAQGPATAGRARYTSEVAA